MLLRFFTLQLQVCNSAHNLPELCYNAIVNNR